MLLGPEVGDASKFLTRYKRLVDVKAIGDIAIPSRSESRNGAHETRTISFWTEFALISKLLVEQIMSLRLSDREKGKKLLEESETKESMALREERSKLEEERLQLIRERAGMQQKRIAAEALQGIFSEVEQLLKSGASLLKKQKTVGK